MEFKLNKDKEIKEKTASGTRVYYTYQFKGQENSNKSTMKIETEKKIGLAEGAVIDIPFKDIQTKMKK